MVVTRRDDREAGRRQEAAPGSRVVVVDRDARVRDLVDHFLHEAGYQVAGLADSSAALAQLEAEPPALVLCEILMPGLDGFALCRQLKASAATRGVKVLLFSMLSAHLRAAEAGADGFLRKPIAETALIAAVSALVPR